MKKIMPLLSIFAIVCLAACGGQKLTDGPIAEKAPAWVNQGSGAFEDADGKKVFYGVGMITGIRDRGLAVQAADQRARAEIAKSLDNYVAVLIRDYMVSTSAVDMQGASEEQDVSVALKGFTKATLKGSIIVGHWRDEVDGTMFSLARLDMDNFKETVNQSEEVEDNIRDFVRNNSEKAFMELKEAETIR